MFVSVLRSPLYRWGDCSRPSPVGCMFTWTLDHGRVLLCTDGATVPVRVLLVLYVRGRQTTDDVPITDKELVSKIIVNVVVPRPTRLKYHNITRVSMMY